MLAENWAAAEDFNPVARALLELHPAAFPLAGAAGLAVLAAVLQYVPRRGLAVALAFGVTFAQAVAAAGWIVRVGPAGWAGAVVVLVMAERLWAWAARERRGPSA